MDRDQAFTILNSGLRPIFQDYAQEIAQLKQTTSLSKQQILRLLIVRDAVEQSFQNNPIEFVEEQSLALALLSDLDQDLKQYANLIVADNKLADCRQSRQPPEEAWWWWLETEISTPKQHRLDRFDWLWNTLSASCLVFSASFLTITGQAFSAVGGFDLLQTISTLSQATGLVLIAGGALTDKGQKAVQKTLEKLTIPPHFHSEVTLGASVLLLLASYGVYGALPLFSQHYYQRGLDAQAKGNLYTAIKYFKEAIAFDPDVTEPHTHLAEIYQNLERFQDAELEYQDGLLKGDIEALNGMGTLILAAVEHGDHGDDSTGLFSSLLDAEVLFRIGLNQPKLDDELEASLHTNLGITLIKRANGAEADSDQRGKLLNEAEEHLQMAIRIEEQVVLNREETFPGQGVAYCFVAALYEQVGNPQLEEYWDHCATRAYPGSIEQYEDIFRLGNRSTGLQLNTKHILHADVDAD